MMSKAILVANTDWYLFNFRRSLANFLKDKGYEVVLISPSGPYVPRLQEAGFRWLAWEVGRQTLSPWREFNAYRRLIQLYRLERPDLTHHFTIKPVLYGTLAARRSGVKAITNSITGRGYVFLSNKASTRVLRFFVRIFYRQVLRSPNCAAIFENQADLDFFTNQDLIPSERAFLIQGVGIDAEHFTPVPEPEGIPVVLLPARMLWDKGVGVLVEAARILQDKIPARFVLIGEPDTGNPANISRTVLEGWVAEGIVEWWGWQQDMKAAYAASHIVTLPSMGEGVPTVLLEAAACARPIVTTNTPGCRDVVKDGISGLIVPPNDPPALADALYKLLIDPNLRGRMGAAGRQLVLHGYTQAQVNQANFEVYCSLISQVE
jgi:glycosyltransferase involved in cell wall biosynthesis